MAVAGTQGTSNNAKHVCDGFDDELTGGSFNIPRDMHSTAGFSEWANRNITYFMCFAAGVLISASFLHLIPQSIIMNPRAPIWLLVGFMGLHIFNRFLTAFVCEKDPSKKD